MGLGHCPSLQPGRMVAVPGNPTRTPRWDGEGNSLKVKMLGRCTDWGCLWDSEKTSRTEEGRTQDGNGFVSAKRNGCAGGTSHTRARSVEGTLGALGGGV